MQCGDDHNDDSRQLYDVHQAELQNAHQPYSDLREALEKGGVYFESAVAVVS